ncbi:MAG: Fic family protein [Clostridia bacterium]|nr:Fic family protein [Clostridia bacterium]
MEEKIEIMNLIRNKQTMESELANLAYGSVEIREKDANKYIYVHYRENGIALTKYVGEYSEQLYNLVLNNSIKAKELKKQIREIGKKLKQLNYIEEELSDNVEYNIDFAKRHLVDTIYKQAILEGVATTFADTESIIEGGKVNNMTTEDVLKIVNLKHAWEFILNKNVILSDTNFALLCEINKLVEEGFYYSAGKIRSVPVSIGGTEWKPALPIESVIKEELNDIFNKKTDDVDIAIELLLYTMKKQIFIDGNKRTSVIYSNHYLISKGKGIIVIPAELTEQFKELLIPYYEGKDEEKIKQFIKEKCYISL